MSSQASRLVVGTAGAFYTAAGALTLLAPGWFYQHLGPFPPFNRHYMGDVGAFVLPLGAALLWTTGRPQQSRALIATATAASTLHLINHSVDAAGEPLLHWLLDVVPLGLLAVALVLVWMTGDRRGERT